MLNAISLMNNKTSKRMKKHKGVLLLKSKASYIMKGLNMDNSNITFKDNSVSYFTPLSSTRTTYKLLNNEEKGIQRKVLLTSTSTNFPKRSTIKHTTIKLKKSTCTTRIPNQRYSSEKDQARYLANCNKSTSYNEKSQKCISRHNQTTSIKQCNYKNSNSHLKKLDENNNFPRSFFMQHFGDESFKIVYQNLENLIRSNKKEISRFIDLKTTQTSIPLIQQEEFDERIRYPMLYCNEFPQKKTFVLSKAFNLNNITNKFSLRKEVQEKVKDMKKKKTLKLRKESIQKWKRIVIHAAIEVKELNIKIEDLKKLQKRSSKPYEHSKSYELFQAVKDGNKEHFVQLVNANYFLVFNFDHAFQTVLHWLAKRNRYDWISFTVRHGASLNSLDCTGRTPLHVASLMNNVESVQVLLYEMANPFCKDNDGYTPNQLTSHPRIIFIFNRVILLYAIHSMGKIKKFEENVKRGLRFLYINELKTKFSLTSFCIIERYNDKKMKVFI